MEIITEKGYNARKVYDPDAVAILEKNAWQDLHLEGKTFTPVPRTNTRLYFIRLLEVAM